MEVKTPVSLSNYETSSKLTHLLSIKAKVHVLRVSCNVEPRGVEELPVLLELVQVMNEVIFL